MAYIEKTAFENRVSNHEFDSISNITGIFETASGTKETCSAGFLCVRDMAAPNDGYDVDFKLSGSSLLYRNTNTWYMIPAEEADGVTPIYACNTYNVNMVEDPSTGNLYKVGVNTLGLPAPKNYPATFTQIHFDNVHMYRFGEGNVSNTVTSKASLFFVVEDGMLKYVPTVPESGVYFKGVGYGNFTAGPRASFEYYDVIACVVSPS
jgi:hypothetical protein